MVLAVEPNDSEQNLGPQLLKERFASDSKYLPDHSSYVVLLHDGVAAAKKGDNVARDDVSAVSSLIRMLKDKNYKFKTATECYETSQQKVAVEFGGPRPGNGVFLPRKV